MRVSVTGTSRIALRSIGLHRYAGTGLFHRGGDAGIKTLHGRAQVHDRGGDDDPDARCNHRVFDRSGAALVAHETRDGFDHRYPSELEHRVLPSGLRITTAS